MKQCLNLLFILVAIAGYGQSSLDSFALSMNGDTIELLSHPISGHFQYSRNQVLIDRGSREMAASFSDPSRVLLRHASVSLENDQNNSIVYRGLDPEFIRWSVYGAEIVNPNHLSNAGRLSDVSSSSAGGVLGIAFDAISQLGFYGAPASQEKLSSLSASLDLEFDQRSQSFLKAGLLGMEASYQSRGADNTNVHIRYSTVGLLTDLGVDFDGEEIKFYDGIIRGNITNNLQYVLIAGQSKNFKSALADSSRLQEFKDLQTIDYSSEFLIAGLKYKHGPWKHSFFASSAKSDRASRLVYQIEQLNVDTDAFIFENDQRKFSYSGRYRLSQKHGLSDFFLQAGLHSNERLYYGIDFRGNDNFIRPGFSWSRSIDIADWNLIVNPQLAINVFENGSISVRPEPSLMSSLRRKQHSLDFNFSLKNRNSDFNRYMNSRSMNPDRSLGTSLSYQYQHVKSQTKFMLRVYRISLSTPAFELRQFLQYGIGELKENINAELFENKSRQSSKGIEIILDKKWTGDWYSQLNISYIDSEFDGIGPAHGDFGAVANFILTRNIKLRNKRNLLFNIAYHQRGGSVFYSYDPEQSEFSYTRLSDYRRLDLRLQYNYRNSEWVLDIQNLTGFSNDAYYYFDAFLQMNRLESQLGTIPILSYKRVF